MAFKLRLLIAMVYRRKSVENIEETRLPPVEKSRRPLDERRTPLVIGALTVLQFLSPKSLQGFCTMYHGTVDYKSLS